MIILPSIHLTKTWRTFIAYALYFWTQTKSANKNKHKRAEALRGKTQNGAHRMLFIVAQVVRALIKCQRQRGKSDGVVAVNITNAPWRPTLFDQLLISLRRRRLFGTGAVRSPPPTPETKQAQVAHFYFLTKFIKSI